MKRPLVRNVRIPASLKKKQTIIILFYDMYIRMYILAALDYVLKCTNPP